MRAYQLKITLQVVKPPVWRRVIVPFGLNFAQLWLIMQEAMGWIGGHMYAFRFPKEGFYISHTPKMWEPVDSMLSDFDDDDGEDIDANEIGLEGLLSEGETFYMDYDFGDGWEHKIVVEKIRDDYSLDFPQVVKYKGDCPPEDVGGPWGYADFLEIIRDPDNPQREEMLEWAESQSFAEYNMENVNKKLRILAEDGYLDVDYNFYNSSYDDDNYDYDYDYDEEDYDDDGGDYDFGEYDKEEAQAYFEYMIEKRKPAYDLETLLNSFTVAVLRKDAQMMGLSGYASLKKADLAKKVYDRWMEGNIFYGLYEYGHIPDDQIEFMRKIIESEGAIAVEDEENFPYHMAVILLNAYLITAYREKGLLYIIATNEAKDKHAELIDSLQDRFGQVFDDLDAYAMAAANLYGAISFQEFAQIYRTQTENELSNEEIHECLQEIIESYEDEDSNYVIINDVLVCSLLKDWQKNEIENLLELSFAHPRYVPEKPDFLKYADWLFYEESETHTQLAEYLNEKYGDELDDAGEDATSIVGEICACIRQWAKPEDILEMLKEYNVVFETRDDAKRVEEMVTKLGAITRIWGFNGTTPAELKRGGPFDSTYIRTEQKVGRNEPCPCGSGKKYKNCCGNVRFLN